MPRSTPVSSETEIAPLIEEAMARLAQGEW
jgi:hypothetical protein